MQRVSRYYYGEKTCEKIFRTNVGVRIFEKLLGRMVEKYGERAIVHSRLKRFGWKDRLLTVLPDGGSFCHQIKKDTTYFDDVLMTEFLESEKVRNDSFPILMKYDSEEIREEICFKIKEYITLHLCRVEDPNFFTITYEIFIESPKKIKPETILKFFQSNI